MFDLDDVLFDINAYSWDLQFFDDFVNDVEDADCDDIFADDAEDELFFSFVDFIEKRFGDVK